ncbi:MAG TPA: UDP-N-acetylmuramoyl-tripeptide--D-alanyl-D-alanine ligase [Thermoanaerobaculia bacterium]|nr:UDP-N-acetylmuramoyl-tripeptide--D-alanyl-D-alanine ligase [Thermoanaerobaculia bacterium]
MARLSVDQVARAVNGRIAQGDPGTECAGAAIDSRKVGSGEVFFAFTGEQTDGHRFVGDALAKGAGAAVVQRGHERSEASTGAIIEVEDTFQALHDLARTVRGQGVPERLVGITGSAGKTTTKELLAALLGSRFRISWSPGNLNNLYGFPMSLLNVPDGTEWMVAEMGMSTPGELRQLSLLGRPDAAVFTVVRPVHLEFFGTVQAIAEAKSELLAGLAPDGLIAANADDPEVRRIVRRHAESPEWRGRVVWYGLRSETADVRGLDLTPEPDGAVGSRFRLEAGGESREVRLPLHGLYNVENCLAAAACAWGLGLTLDEIANAVREVRPAAMRGIVHRIAGPRGSYTLVDDSYNSNPDALGKALEGARQLAAGPGGRYLAVLGDMLELGPEGPRFHRESGERAAELGFAPVLGVGELSRELAAGAGTGGDWRPDADAAAAWAASEVREGDVLLVKGSRGVKLDKVVRRLLEEAGAEISGEGRG